MATCYLGNAYKWNSDTGKAITTKPNMMPDAFGIAKVKTSSDPEFYLGYSTKTYDGTAQAFEKRFFEYLGTHPGAALKQAFDYANLYTDYGYPDANDPFVPNWYGNPNYTGIPTGFPMKGGS